MAGQGRRWLPVGDNQRPWRTSRRRPVFEPLLPPLQIGLLLLPPPLQLFEMKDTNADASFPPMWERSIPPWRPAGASRCRNRLFKNSWRPIGERSPPEFLGGRPNWALPPSVFTVTKVRGGNDDDDDDVLVVGCLFVTIMCTSNCSRIFSFS